jgi:hypothetical protein
MESISHSKHSRPAESALSVSAIMKAIRIVVFGLVCLPCGCATAAPVKHFDNASSAMPNKSDEYEVPCTVNPKDSPDKCEIKRNVKDADLSEPCLTSPMDDPDACILA